MPPTRSSASKMIGLRPSFTSWYATPNPIGPAPSTAICSLLMLTVPSELQRDRAVHRIVEGFVYCLRKRRRLDMEDAFPIDHFELVACRQRLELCRGKRRVFIEECVDL